MQAVFFDLDGTLLDTVPDIRASLNGVLARFGYPQLDMERVSRFVGDGARKLVERALPAGAETDEVYTAFRAAYGNSEHALTRPYAGIEEMLGRLKAQGVKLAVITNKPQAAAVSAMEKFYSGVFDFIGGDSGDFPCKPDPSLTRYCALSLRVPLKACVFVGDGEPDILTARRAGMRCVSVLWGYRTREQLAAAGGEIFAETPEELQKILLNFSENR